MADLPHFGHPFKRGNVVEQDTDKHVMACENVIVRCPVGFRLERPDFGIPWPEYRQHIDPSELTSAMMRLEPRSRLTATEIRSLLDASRSEITIEVQT